MINVLFTLFRRELILDYFIKLVYTKFRFFSILKG